MGLHTILIELLDVVTKRHQRSRPGDDAPRIDSGPTGLYPMGVYPVPTASRLAVVDCPKCGYQIGLTRWDNWNGFFVACPQCGATLGRSWDLRSIVFASMLLNAFSFFFTMRPRSAAGAAFGQLAFIVAGGWWLSRRDQLDTLLAAYMLGVGFLPLIVNLFLFMNHEAVQQKAQGRPTRAR